LEQSLHCRFLTTGLERQKRRNRLSGRDRKSALSEEIDAFEKELDRYFSLFLLKGSKARRKKNALKPF